MKSCCLFISVFCLLFSFELRAQAQNYKNEFGFQSDNDAYLAFGQDQYYTNGLFIKYRHALKKANLNPKIENKTWEAEFGQYMFNANTGSVRNIEAVDRPFAAYLYGGAKLNWFLKNEQVFEASLNVGTIGQNAKGKEVQQFLHSTVGFYEINGWQYQVSNEVGVNTSFKYSTLLSRKHTDNDLSLQSYLNVGTTFSGAGAGILFRAGEMNKFFRSVTYSSRISNSKADTIPDKEIFFFTKPMLNFIAYDATVEGGLFTDDKGPVTYNAKRFQYSHEFGIAYAVKRITFNFSVTFKSKDTKSQLNAHQFGSACLYYRFN